jgi:hypothetical protein
MKLANGQRKLLSESNGIRCYIEKSGNGKTVRWVRESSAGFTVFKTESSR